MLGIRKCIIKGLHRVARFICLRRAIFRDDFLLGKNRGNPSRTGFVSKLRYQSEAGTLKIKTTSP